MYIVAVVAVEGGNDGHDDDDILLFRFLTKACPKSRDSCTSQECVQLQPQGRVYVLCMSKPETGAMSLPPFLVILFRFFALVTVVGRLPRYRHRGKHLVIQCQSNVCCALHCSSLGLARILSLPRRPRHRPPGRQGFLGELPDTTPPQQFTCNRARAARSYPF